ncbi:cation:proton antiporter [Streptomyces sp. 7N604]|uniref:cation:proton antiporter n=1 Tax=Streptomyces sp. 7N604 TaxID=3457415 RepID=UPI003FD3C8EE
MFAQTPVEPLPATQSLIFLLQVGLLLALAHAMGRLAMKCAMPSVVGELCVGIVLGPTLLQLMLPEVSWWLFPTDPEQMHLLDAVGQIGVLLLVGLTGVHLDAALVRRQGLTAARVSGFGLIIPLALGTATGYWLPRSLTPDGADRTVVALFLGVAMCVSAIPVIAKTLMDMNLMHRDIGQLTLTAGMVDDAFGWMMLSLISAMATTGLTGGAVLSALISLAGVLLLAAVAGRSLIRPLFRLTNGAADVTPTIATAMTLILLSAAGTQALHLEAAFGAFVCGVLIGKYGRPDPARLAPLRTVTLVVFAPLFFATAGLRMDLTALGRPAVLATAAVVLLVAVVGKFAGAYVGARTSGLGNWEALALGAGMNARGVVEVIVAMIGLRLGVLNTATYTVIVLVAIATSVMAPPLLRIAMTRIEQTAEETERCDRQQLSPPSFPTGDR